MSKRSRKLTKKHYLHLVNFAFTKFVDLEARAKEDAAREKFINLLLADIESKIAPQADFLKSIDHHHELSYINLPSVYPKTVPGKQFTRPDGVVVTRDSSVTLVDRKGEREWKIENFGQLQRFRNGVARPSATPTSYAYQPVNRRLNLPKNIPWIRGEFHLGFIHDYASGVDKSNYVLALNHTRCTWISPETFNAMIAMFESSDERCEAENKLWRAAIDMILASPTFEELIKFWPEAVEIEKELFPDADALKNSVLVINDETKKLLCANMNARGVESTVCQAA